MEILIKPCNIIYIGGILSFTLDINMTRVSSSGDTQGHTRLVHNIMQHRSQLANIQ